MLGWPPANQSHDYHPGLGSMGPIDNIPPPIADQGQFMRSQHMPVEHGHQSSPIITSTQPITGHQMPTGFAQQSPKAPLANQSWKSNEPRRPKTYNCTACNKWFTSSGHLKRHYNTTLHKNAVKNGKEPDPATLPISVHHHPTRENNHSGGRGGGAPARSPPDLPSSRSPPNLMAGPSGEATRGLLHTPTTHCNSSSSNSSSDSSAAVLVQQQLVHLPHSGVMPVNSPVPSSLAGHHQQQMGSAPHQLGLQQQQQQQQLHLPTDSPGQPVHHTTSSPIPPQAASHMSCPSPMVSSPHPHHMNSPPGSVHPAMTSPTAMGGTTMPHQPYPNALPPHVTITTPAVLLESTQPVTTMQLTTIGNEQNDQQHQLNMLPSFTIFDQKNMPNFQIGVLTGFVVEQNQIPNVNVGGLSAEEIAPQDSFESSATTYDPYSPSRYKSLTDMEVTTNGEQVSLLSYQLEQSHIDLETNNNHLSQLRQAKEDLDPNIGLQPKKKRKIKTNSSKQGEVTTTKANSVSQNGVYMCVECDKFFMKGCYLTQHNKSSHSGEKPFKCSQCGKRFQNQEKYEKHVQMHTLARKHQCTSCPKIFAHKTDLKRHTCIHTGKRPFRCDTCDKGFIRQDHMKKHQDTHNRKARLSAQRQNNQRLNAQRLNNSRFNTQRFNAQRLNVQRSNDERSNDILYDRKL